MHLPPMERDTEYHPLSPIQSSGTARTKPPILIHPPTKSTSSYFTRRSALFLRIGAFTIMESGFIILAGYAMSRPIPLPTSSSISPTEAKGGVTIVSIIWHAIAVHIVKDILLGIFSGEWMEQVRRTGRIVLEETDLVSRVSAGYFDQIYHFATRRASFPFRLSFTSALLLLALNGIGPSALTVNPVAIPQPTRIQVANLNVTQGLFTTEPSIHLAMDRADLITRLELLENNTYSFRSNQSNVLIPWPSADLISSDEIIQYETDVITYDFNCSWRTPTAVDSAFGPNLVWNISNDAYLLYTGPDSSSNSDNISLCDAMILPLLSGGALNDTSTSPISGVFFVGRNSSEKEAFLNLDGLPTTHLGPPSSSPPENAASPGDCFPEELSALICDPRFEIHPATAVLSGGSLSTSKIHSNAKAAVGNIPPEAANAIFSLSLGDALSSIESFSVNSSQYTNNIARVLFLSDPTFKRPTELGVKPLPLENITQNMNKVFLSSSKAFLSGYQVNDTDTTFPAFQMVETRAVREVEQLALVGSEPFLIVVTILVGLLIALLTTIAAMVRIEDIRTFDLKHIVETLGVTKED
ncbi:hypothetical protein NP233_g5447 [Leucocoprinus birnbaumii]|uniref:Uncharacterized protein n=1 Tax=Leucocoprinus birnbaumii TaxID=56174 RepID=A0AAD5VWI4_9AGAR|nr:hypothetical protein NP233_g5447 [Leucocoprinus birnbaumii]